MQYFIAVILLAAAGTRGEIQTKRHCVKIRGVSYEEEILKSNVPSPYQLTIDHNTNTLFFSYTADTTETFKIAYLNFKSNEYGLVDGIHGGFAIAVDHYSNIVYMGGEDGVYTYDYETYTATHMNMMSGDNIWQMFFKDGLYFTTYPKEKAFVYKQGEMAQISKPNEKIMLLAVKNDGTLLYSNSSGLFTYKKKKGKSEYISDFVINAFTSDIDGNIYFSTPTSIYYINDKSREILKLYTSNHIFGVAIEGNGNIIYANENSIIRLNPSKNMC